VPRRSIVTAKMRRVETFLCENSLIFEHTRSASVLGVIITLAHFEKVESWFFRHRVQSEHASQRDACSASKTHAG
jgi:hypothetical protein